MRLLHVVDTMDPERGGVSQAVRTIATEAARSGIWNEVLTLDTPTGKSQDAMYLVNEIGPSKGPWSYSGALIPWLVQNLSRFDVIIVHGLWLYSGYAVKQALAKYKSSSETRCSDGPLPSMFIMPHGMLDPYFQRAKTRKIKALRNWLYWKVIESHIINGSDGVLFTCKQECLLAKQPFKPYKPKRELIVGLGVANPPTFNYSMIDAFERLCHNVSFGKYILFLGRVDDKKGVELLLQAYEQLLSTTGTGPIPHLVIAGPGMESNYGLMLQMFVNANTRLKSHTHFTGMLSGQEKWAAMYGCEVFILPSHQENFGIAVVEALACGKPVLISRQVNIHAEICNEGAAIVGDDSIRGTYEMLHRWLSTSESNRAQMRTAARRCYEKNFAVGRATGNLINAISNTYKND